MGVAREDASKYLRKNFEQRRVEQFVTRLLQLRDVVIFIAALNVLGPPSPPPETTVHSRAGLILDDAEDLVCITTP